MLGNLALLFQVKKCVRRIFYLVEVHLVMVGYRGLWVYLEVEGVWNEEGSWVEVTVGDKGMVE